MALISRPIVASEDGKTCVQRWTQPVSYSLNGLDMYPRLSLSHLTFTRIDNLNKAKGRIGKGWPTENHSSFTTSFIHSDDVFHLLRASIYQALNSSVARENSSGNSFRGWCLDYADAASGLGLRSHER